MINLTLTIRFLENMKQLRIKDAKKKIRKIKIAMLCSDFVKIMKGRIRYKYTLQTRHNLALLKSIRFIVEVLQPNVLESARG